SMNLLRFLSSSRFLESHVSHIRGFFTSMSSCCFWYVKSPFSQTKAASVIRGLSSEVLTTIPETAIIFSMWEVSTFLKGTLSWIPFILTANSIAMGSEYLKLPDLRHWYACALENSRVESG